MKIRLLLVSISYLILIQPQAQICGADFLHRQKLTTDSLYALQTKMNIKALKKRGPKSKNSQYYLFLFWHAGNNLYYTRGSPCSSYGRRYRNCF